MSGRGMLIAIEGIDGSGKNTQAQHLAKSIDARVMSFPNYETESGKVILGNLQNCWAAHAGEGEIAPRINALALQAIFAANRYEAAGEIEMRLGAGQHIVLDRYWPSGVVYGTCDGLDSEWLIRIHQRLPEPNCWILLDVDPLESIKRRPERRDRYERDANMVRRRELYLEFFRKPPCSSLDRFLPDAWHIVDGVGTEEDVHLRILAKLGESLQR